MALVTPIVNNIPAFDATESTNVTFTANGGDQIVKNEIQIINNATNVVVYSNTETTYTLGQNIPANTLVNGNYYKVAFRTYDISDNASEWSNYQPFYCYSLPTLNFNVSEGQTIYTPNLDLTLTYNQAEGERLESAVINYYDTNNNLISTSGNLFNSNTPPVVFEYPLKNFENNKTYRVQAEGITVNGTPITTGLISFHTNYETIENGSELYLTMDSCNGYINVRSAPVISALEGENESNPETLSYIEKEDDAMVDLTSVVGDLDIENSYSPWIRWYDITPISNAFLFRLWFYPARTSFKVAEIVSTDESNRVTITFNRGRTEDYLCIRTTDGTQIDKGLGIICNGNTKVFLWLKVISSTWDVQTEILENSTTIFDWNNSNDNANYNMSTDINYVGEEYGSYVPKRAVYRTLSGAFDSVIIGNGIFDELDLSININKPYSSDIPQKDISSVLFVRFNHDIENDAPTGYTKATLQRKDNSIITWFNLSDIEISSDVPTEIDYNDYIIPSGIKQTYGLTLYQDETPSDTYTIDIVPKWGRVFLSDNSESYRLNYAVIYSNGVQNIQNGVLMPIAATYPTVIQNAEGNYKSGSLQFKVLGYQFEIDRTLDRNSIVQQTNDILAFLTNKKPKCIKDYNGNIFICRVINSPQISYDANWGNGITTISFDWVEQAKYDKYDEMVEMDIINNTIPIPIPPTPPVPPPPTPIEPFVEKVYLFNGNDPDTIYPTQGIYEYDMYFGEKGDVNSANFYMPTDNYNIISYKMNNITQLIPQKQHVGDDYIYNLYFKESLNNTDNGKIDIVIQDENNNTISYTFNFIYATSSDYITSSKYYVKNTNTFLTCLESGYGKYSYEFKKKFDGEAYGTILYTNSDSYGVDINFLFISDNLNAVKTLMTVTNINTGETYTVDYEDMGGTFYTCEFNNKTWYIAGDFLLTLYSDKDVEITPHDLIFMPYSDNNNSWSYYGYNFLQHIYSNFAYIENSIYYTNNSDKELLIGYNNKEIAVSNFSLKHNGEAYITCIYYVINGRNALAPLIISDNAETVADFLYDGSIYSDTCEFMNKTWYISAIESVSFGENNTNILFYADDIYSHNNDWSYYGLNLLEHIYSQSNALAKFSPKGDILTWLDCANINHNEISNIEELTFENLINDRSSVFRMLCCNNNAVDYMLKNSNRQENGWDEILSNNSIGMSIAGRSINEYLIQNILANWYAWRYWICTSEYVEYILNVNVPIMTSNTTPDGECFCYPNNNIDAWKAFDNNENTFATIYFNDNLTNLNYIGYKFPYPTCCYMAKAILDGTNYSYSTIGNISLKIQASNDNIEWEDLQVVNDFSFPTGTTSYEIELRDEYENYSKHLYYRLAFNKGTEKDTKYFTNVIGLSFLCRYKYTTPSPITVTPFSTATNEELAHIINSYYSGDISLEDIQSVWNVGDTREIDISAIAASGGSGDTAWSVGESHRAQTVTIEILDFVHDNLTTPINGKTKALITVDLKNFLYDGIGSENTELGYMNIGYSNLGGWAECDRRAWCNNGFYQALPVYIKTLVKPVNKLTSIGEQSSTIQTTSDYIFLPSEVEVFNSATLSFEGEGTVYNYFNKGALYRHKSPNTVPSYSMSDWWWLRSPYLYYTYEFACVNDFDTPEGMYAVDFLGIAPAFCM